MRVSFFIIAIIISSNLVFAADGNFLYSQCRNYGGEIYNERDVWCQAYITGYVEAIATERLVTKVGANKFCIESEMTFNQIISSVNKFLENNPELLNRPGRHLVNDALALAFPCKKMVHKIDNKHLAGKVVEHKKWLCLKCLGEFVSEQGKCDYCNSSEFVTSK